MYTALAVYITDEKCCCWTRHLLLTVQNDVVCWEAFSPLYFCTPCSDVAVTLNGHFPPQTYTLYPATLRRSQKRSWLVKIKNWILSFTKETVALALQTVGGSICKRSLDTAVHITSCTSLWNERSLKLTDLSILSCQIKQVRWLRIQLLLWV